MDAEHIFILLYFLYMLMWFKGIGTFCILFSKFSMSLLRDCVYNALPYKFFKGLFSKLVIALNVTNL